jgi:hypothetical protein
MNRIQEQKPVDSPRALSGGWARRSLHDAGWVISLFLVGLGAKLALILKFGNSFPYWDQWGGEAFELFVPCYQNQFSLATLFQPHNEHRIFFTRFCELALLLANSQWDNRLEIVFNAFLHCAAVAGFGWTMASLLGRKYWPFLWVLLALVLVLPFGWENTLWGFQSSFYFLMAFSLTAVWLLGLNEPGSNRWRLGVLVSVAALFTMASGFLAGATFAILTVLDTLKQRGNWRRHLPGWALAAGLVIAGLLLSPHPPDRAGSRAHSAGDFVVALAKNLAFPWPLLPWYALLNLLPFLLLGWVWFRAEAEESQPVDRLILGMVVWAGLQAMAVAYARGGAGSAPAWRYLDVFSIIMVANALAILRLVTHYRQKLRFPSFCYLGFAAWAFGCLSGLWFLSDRALRLDIPAFEFNQKMQLQTARAFLATDDPGVLHQPSAELLLPKEEAVIWLLRNPVVRLILPACARDALPLTPKDGPNQTFVRGGCGPAEDGLSAGVSWGSCSSQGAAAPANFESAPIRKSALPFLEIPVAGDLGEPGLWLDLVDTATGKKTRLGAPSTPGQQWVNTYAQAPAGTFTIMAGDENPAKWFAFKEPRELGRLSYWAMRIAMAWKFFIGTGAVFLAWSLVPILSKRWPFGKRE